MHIKYGEGGRLQLILKSSAFLNDTKFVFCHFKLESKMNRHNDAATFNAVLTVSLHTFGLRSLGIYKYIIKIKRTIVIFIYFILKFKLHLFISSGRRGRKLRLPHFHLLFVPACRMS